MTLDQWMTLFISMVLSGIGIYLAYRTNESLKVIEKNNENLLNEIRLNNAQLMNTMQSHTNDLFVIVTKLISNENSESKRGWTQAEIDKEIDNLKKLYSED